jgi:AcrR family transcriptional regulator
MYPIHCCIMTAIETDRPKRRREVTVERLLDAALQTFAEQGFAAASVEDVCRRGGFTRGAFYSSFSTKDELFAALFAREVTRELGRVEELLTGLAAEADPVAAAVDRCLGAMRTDRTWTLVATEYALHAARHPEAAALLARHRHDLLTRLSGLIEHAATDAGLPLTVAPLELARTVCALHDGLTLQCVSDPDDGTAAATVAALERPALLMLLRAATAPRPTD